MDDDSGGLGSSAGRSAKHRTGEGAIRRNTPRERQDIDPPWADDPVHLYSRRTEGVMAAVASVALGAIMALIILMVLGIF